MPDKPIKAHEKTNQSPAWYQDVVSRIPRSRTWRVVFGGVAAICLFLLVVSLISAFSPSGRQSLSFLKHLPVLGWIVADKPAAPLESSLAPVLGSRSPQELLSSHNLLDRVGKSPADVSRPSPSESQKTDESPEGKDVQVTTRGAEAKPRDAVPVRTDRVQPEDQLSPKPVPQLVETPVVVTKEPGQDEPALPKRDRKFRKGAQQKVPPKTTDEQAEKPLLPGDAVPEKAGSLDLPSKREPTVADTSTKKPAEAETAGKPEQYELPGSLTVNIKNYQSTRVKWGLVVIFDDSAAMGLKSKVWEPNKMHAAVNVVGKLSSVLTPGSRLAVRDFYCKGQEQAKKSGAAPCLSRMMYGWAPLPFAGLKDKLDETRTAGQTNPCAAAAYSLKADFSGLADLTPRILMVTGGAKKCDYRDVVKQVERQGGTGKTRVDVFGLGINKKRESGYSSLAGKTGGVFLRVEQPADVDSALAKYSKVLKTPVEKNIEVRGEKVNIRIAEGEEVTLAPGSYTVLLPAVPGLDASSRKLKDVKIVAGQPKVLNVVVKKGRPSIGTGKK